MDFIDIKNKHVKNAFKDLVKFKIRGFYIIRSNYKAKYIKKANSLKWNRRKGDINKKELLKQ